MSALSAIGQEGQTFYYDGAAPGNYVNAVTTQEMACQTVAPKDSRTIEVQTDI